LARSAADSSAHAGEVTAAPIASAAQVFFDIRFLLVFFRWAG
jgi:hypothetical protein